MRLFTQIKCSWTYHSIFGVSGRYLQSAATYKPFCRQLGNRSFLLKNVVFFVGRALWNVVRRKREAMEPKVLIPTRFLSNRNDPKLSQKKRVVVFLVSPFAMIRDSVLSFLEIHKEREVSLYFSADCELILNNNINNNLIQTNMDKLVIPLPVISDSFNKDRSFPVHAYSLQFNSIPLFYCSYARSSFVQLTDAVGLFVFLHA